MMNLNFEVKCVARHIAVVTFTNEMYLKYSDSTDIKVINIMKDKMLTLTRLDTKVADIEMEAYKVNDKDIVDKCERMRHRIKKEMKDIRVKFNL